MARFACYTRMRVRISNAQAHGNEVFLRNGRIEGRGKGRGSQKQD